MKSSVSGEGIDSKWWEFKVRERRRRGAGDLLSLARTAVAPPLIQNPRVRSDSMVFACTAGLVLFLSRRDARHRATAASPRSPHSGTGPVFIEMCPIGSRSNAGE